MAWNSTCKENRQRKIEQQRQEAQQEQERLERTRERTREKWRKKKAAQRAKKKAMAATGTPANLAPLLGLTSTGGFDNLEAIQQRRKETVKEIVEGEKDLTATILDKLNETLTQRRKDLLADPMQEAVVERYKAETAKITASSRKLQQQEAAARATEDPMGGLSFHASSPTVSTPTPATAAAAAGPTTPAASATTTVRGNLGMRSPVTIKTTPDGKKLAYKTVQAGQKSPATENALYVPWNEDIVRITSAWTNEAFLRWFTVEIIDDCSPHSAQTCLGIAWERGILSSIDPAVLKHANLTAWRDKKSRVKSSPLCKQIKSRLTKEYKEYAKSEK